MTSALDVAVVTCAEYAELDEQDRPLPEALARRGLKARPVCWDDPAFDWAGARMHLLRNPWDYYRRYRDFAAWLDRVGPLGRMWNPVQVVRWSSHKRYLLDLAARGAPVVPTVVLEEAADLAPLMDARGWPSVIVKPAVSAGGWRTGRVDRNAVAAGQRLLAEAVQDSEALVQPYLPSIDEDGEHSLVFFERRLSHAVRREAGIRKPGHLPRAFPFQPSQEEVQTAEAVLRLVEGELLYARVDLVRDLEGQWRLLELEVMEPSLFLPHAPGALDRFADAIAARLQRQPASASGASTGPSSS